MKSFSIILETGDFLAVNKSSGVLSIPDRHDTHPDSLFTLLKKTYPDIFVVHRLDRLTSGIILFAKNAAAHKHLSTLFETRKIRKTYVGIVVGKMSESSGVIDAPLSENPFRKGEMKVFSRGKPAVTEFELSQAFNSYSVVKFMPLTGRTHQIRVHSKYINHPLACDPVYGDGKPVLLSSFKKKFKLGKDVLEERPLLDRLALHAFSLSFKGIDGKDYFIEAPLPKDMNAVVQQLNKAK